MKKSVFYLLIALLFPFFSCGDFKDVTFMGIDNVKLIKLSQEGVDAEISVKIKNPNKVAFTIYKSDMDVTLSGINAGKAHLANNVRIKPNSEDTYVFKVKSDFTHLSLTDIPTIISMAMKKNIKIGLKGNLRVGKIFVKRNFPVDMSQNVPLDFLK